MVAVFHDHSDHVLDRSVPLSILNVDLAFFDQSWLEVRVHHRDL